jgi:hypothetical protein
MSDQPEQPQFPRKFPKREDGTVDWDQVRSKFGKGTTPDKRRLTYKAKAKLIEQEKRKLTNREAAEEYGVSMGTWQQYRHCRQGKALIKATREFLDDPKRLVELELNEEIPSQFMNLLHSIDVMERSDDHVNAAKFRIKLLEMAGFFDKNQFNVNVDAQNIQLTISSSDGDGYIKKALQEGPQPVPEAEYTIVDDKDRSSTTT